MWGTLKADFTEFVSTVTTDATDALAAVDEQLDNADEDAELTPMIDPDTGIVIDTKPSLEDMKEYLYRKPEVFLDPLPEEVLATLAENFDLNDKTDDITKLLQENQDTLEQTFSQLTDQVEYKDFWTRFYYRLDEERIEATYEQYYDPEDNEGDEGLQNPAAGALTTVTTFLGAAVTRLVDDEEDGEEGEPSPFYTTAGTSAASAMNFLAGGRPPFVLNTAVSEDGDDDENTGKRNLLDDDDEEEELGWDDDEDDEDYDPNEENDDNDDDDDDEDDEHVHKIEFKDVEKEKLQQELEQAVAERDQLKSTLDLQADEIKKLREMSTSATSDDSKQVEALKMQLFEKDSEIAALQASVEDSRRYEEEEDKPKQVEASEVSEDQFNQVKTALQSREDELTKIQAELNNVVSQLQESQSQLAEERKEQKKQMEQGLNESQAVKQALDKSNAENQSLQIELQSMRAAIAKLEDENDQLSKQQKSSGNENAKMLADTEARFQNEIQLLTTQNKALEEESVVAKKQVAELNAELQSTKSELEKAREELAERPPSPGSSSTGIKVASPVAANAPLAAPSPTVTKLDDGDDEDDAWDDDW